MINETDYIELLKNCAKGNERINVHRKTGSSLFDPQTGTIQKRSFHRDVTHRFKSSDPMQVVQYQAKRWKRNPNPSTDDIEHKYFLQCNPALGEYYNQASYAANTNGATGVTSTASNENSNDAISVATPDNRRVSTRAVTTVQDYDDFDDFPLDDIEEDGSDEDDWGAKRKKGGSARKNGTKSSRRSGVSSVHQRQYVATLPPGSGEAKPFACQLCPAKYKSRPGLNYHKQHVHGESSTPPGSSSIDSTRISAGAVANLMSPSVKIASSCSQCQGDRFQNNDSKPEDLVSCHDCGASVHPSCLKFTANMVLSTKKYGWQCIECKSCAICGTSDNDDKLLFCDDCDRGMHLYCLNPPLEKTPENAWSCHLCQKEFGAQASMPLN